MKKDEFTNNCIGEVLNEFSIKKEDVDIYLNILTKVNPSDVAGAIDVISNTDKNFILSVEYYDPDEIRNNGRDFSHPIISMFERRDWWVWSVFLLKYVSSNSRLVLFSRSKTNLPILDGERCYIPEKRKCFVCKKEIDGSCPALNTKEGFKYTHYGCYEKGKELVK